MDRMYRYPQGQQPQIPRTQGQPRGLLSDPGQTQPNRFQNRMQGLQQQQGQIQNEIQRRGGAANATGFNTQLGNVQGQLATMQNQQQNMQNPQYQQMQDQRGQLMNEIHRRGGMANAGGFTQQFNDLNQQMRGIRNAPATPPPPAAPVDPGMAPPPPTQPVAPQAPVQPTLRQQQRQQYLARHPMANGNQPGRIR